jgi:hypothetical protein
VAKGVGASCGYAEHAEDGIHLLTFSNREAHNGVLVPSLCASFRMPNPRLTPIPGDTRTDFLSALEQVAPPTDAQPSASDRDSGGSSWSWFAGGAALGLVIGIGAAALWLRARASR